MPQVGGCRWWGPQDCAQTGQPPPTLGRRSPGHCEPAGPAAAVGGRGAIGWSCWPWGTRARSDFRNCSAIGWEAPKRTKLKVLESPPGPARVSSTPVAETGKPTTVPAVGAGASRPLPLAGWRGELSLASLLGLRLDWRLSGAWIGPRDCQLSRRGVSGANKDWDPDGRRSKFPRS